MSPSVVTEAFAVDPAAAIEGPAAAVARCRNCEAPLGGPYCSECGQRDRAPDPALRELIGDAWETLTEVDGKIFASMRLLLTRPGALTVEYLRGRRARYLPPFRLYLICSVAFFLVNAIDKPGRGDAATNGDALVEISADVRPGSETEAAPVPVDSARPDSFLNPDTDLERRIDRGFRRLKADRQDLKGTINEQVPNAMFVLMPLYAALVAILYRSRQRQYPAHLVFALHVHAFFFVGLAVVEIFELLDGVAPVVGHAVDVAAFGWVVAYFPTAMRRVYGGRWKPTLLRAATLWALYSLLGSILTAVAVVGYLYATGAP